MRSHVKAWRVVEMARVLKVSCSGYYRYCRGKLSRRAQENARLLEKIKQWSRHGGHLIKQHPVCSMLSVY